MSKIIFTEHQQRVKEIGLTQSMSRRATASTTPPSNPFLATLRMMSSLSKQPAWPN